MKHDDDGTIYARWLAAGVIAGYSVLTVSFVIYLTGALPPSIPPEKLPALWGLPYRDYVAATGAPTGWSWVKRLGQGDLLNFFGVAILCITTLACYVRMLPRFIGSRSRALAWLAIAEIVVLAAAASGLAYTNH